MAAVSRLEFTMETWTWPQTASVNKTSKLSLKLWQLVILCPSNFYPRSCVKANSTYAMCAASAITRILNGSTTQKRTKTQTCFVMVNYELYHWYFLSCPPGVRSDCQTADLWVSRQEVHAEHRGIFGAQPFCQCLPVRIVIRHCWPATAQTLLHCPSQFPSELEESIPHSS